MGRRLQTRGSTMVELALVAVVFMVLLLGIADLSQFLFLQQALFERARTAARWGSATDPTNSTAIQNVVLYNQSTVPPSGTPLLGLTASMVNVSTSGSGTDNYFLTVQISGHQYTLVSPYLHASYTGSPITVSVPLGGYYSAH